MIEILEENNYYPFGLRHKGYNNNPITNHKYELYNGVEYEEALGLNLYEMDFRSYDPAIGRFNGIDPVTHFSQGTSVAFDNNPIFWADPSGADVEEFAWGTRYTGADAQSMFAQLQSQYGGNDSDDNQSTQPKYQFYGISPTGEQMNLNFGTKDFNILTGYGDDPADLRKAKLSQLKELFRILPRKEQVAILRAFKIPSKYWVGIIQKIGKVSKLGSGVRLMPNYDVYDEGLTALPFGLGLPFQPLNDDFHSGARQIENDLMWEDVLRSFNKMMNTDVLNDVIIIYSNENLFRQSTINTSEAENLSSRHATGNYRYAYYGTQSGGNLHIFGMYLIKND